MTNITSPFKIIGILPFNANNSTDTDFICSSVSDRTNSDDEEKQHINTDVVSPSISSEKEIINNITSLPDFSNSKSFAVTPGDILSYRKAREQKITNRDYEKRKTVIVTYEINKIKIEQKDKEREEEKKAETRKIDIKSKKKKLKNNKKK
ncbi:hypothetical protein AVEN_200354-1 [Araneus ventricosus]|uniref:Uncharacterized protein n=1 Tax=Araneus ventricosus TaxID=182803 RepID=A0A4Y2QMZ5_ARAVE|nr:hypothetical protein AVEN_200354-1 [Araneus ventricosus]